MARLITTLALVLLGRASAVDSCLETAEGEALPKGELAAGCCKLSQSVPQKPFPSLTQCYKYNTNEGACCKSGHDSHVSTEYSSLLSPACLREFDHLEFYFCLGCNSQQFQYTDEATDPPQIRVCQTFANKLFAPPDAAGDFILDSDRFERCGLNMPVVNTNKEPGAAWSIGGWEDSPDWERQFIMPYQVFSNATTFLNVVKPPFFAGYDVVVVPDDASCFSAASKAATWGALSAAVAIVLGVAATL